MENFCVYYCLVWPGTQSKLKCCCLDQGCQTQIHSRGQNVKTWDKVAGQRWFFLKIFLQIEQFDCRFDSFRLRGPVRQISQPLVAGQDSARSITQTVMYSALTRQVTSLCKHFVSRQIPSGGGHPGVNPRFLMSHLILITALFYELWYRG